MSARAHRRWWGLLLLAVCACPSTRTDPRAELAPLRVAAAADLTRVFGALGPRFTKASGPPVIFTFAATGVLARQLGAGAPYDVLASADTAAVDAAIAAGRCRASSRLHFATGRLALVSAPGVALPSTLAELAHAHIARVAIANPAHAPYGRAAMAALTQSGLAEELKAKLVFADNVAHALTLARSGNADLAFTARALLTADAGFDWLDVDPHLHPALDQAMVACSAQPAALAFIAFVKQHPELFAEYGFSAPSERSE